LRSRALRQGGADRLEAEGLAFQQRVRDGYLRLVGEEPERVRLVDATGTPDEVYSALLGALADVLPASLATEAEPHGRG
jgi:dTMP kinase